MLGDPTPAGGSPTTSRSSSTANRRSGGVERCSLLCLLDARSAPLAVTVAATLPLPGPASSQPPHLGGVSPAALYLAASWPPWPRTAAARRAGICRSDDYCRIVGLQAVWSGPGPLGRVLAIGVGSGLISGASPHQRGCQRTSPSCCRWQLVQLATTVAAGRQHLPRGGVDECADN